MGMIAGSQQRMVGRRACFRKGAPLLLLLHCAQAFLPPASSLLSPRRLYSPRASEGGEEVEWYGGEGTNDLKRLRIECFNDKDKAQVLDPWQLSDFLLLEAGAYSSFIEDADAGSEAESPIFGEPGEPLPKVKIWERSTVAADYALDASVEDVIDMVQEAFDLHDRPKYSVEVIRDRDWVAEVQEGWKPIAIGDSLLVKFPWHEEKDLEGLVEGRKVLMIEGGAAFGSGEHETTVMCCKWLEGHLAKNKDVSILDYGSGSGILGLAALLFGAKKRVEGVEIDAMAIDSAYRNARMNALTMPFYRPVGEECPPSSWSAVPEQPSAASPSEEGSVDLRRDPYDVVVVNILARPLVELAGTLTDLTRPGGYIVLAGLLNEQVARVATAYTEKGFAISKLDSMGDWALLVGTKK